jgi:cobalt-precorrin 5A hydrolase
MGADPVITTATDINGAFPADIFAKENGLKIANREGIAKVSSAALKGRPVTISIRDYPPEEPVDVVITDDASYEDMASLRLCPGRYAVGIGCRRGKSFEEIREFAERMLSDAGIEISEIGAVATIDIKAFEPGIRALAECWKVPLITYEASVLERAPGEFRASEFVRETVGVDNVSERAAVLAAGAGSQLTVHKKAENGITFAAARRR